MSHMKLYNEPAVRRFSCLEEESHDENSFNHYSYSYYSLNSPYFSFYNEAVGDSDTRNMVNPLQLELQEMVSHFNATCEEGTEKRDFGPASTRRRKNKRKEGSKRGRPPSLFINVSDSELTEEQRKQKKRILRRRQRQNMSYRRKKLVKQLQREQGIFSKNSGNKEQMERDNVVQSPTSSSNCSHSFNCMDTTNEAMQCGASPEINHNDATLSTNLLEVFSLDDFAFENDGLEPCRDVDIRVGPDTLSKGEEASEDAHSNDVSTDFSRIQLLQPESGEDSCASCLSSHYRNVFTEMPFLTKEAWEAFSLFPASFSWPAAQCILGWSEQDSSISEKLLRTLQLQQILQIHSNGRLQLYPMAKNFILEYITSKNIYFGKKLVVWKCRLLGYYCNLVKEKVNEEMFLLHGTCKQQVESLYTLEKDNIETALKVARELGWRTYRWVFVVASCLLKYIWDAKARLEESLKLLQTFGLERDESFEWESTVEMHECCLEEENFGYFMSLNVRIFKDTLLYCNQWWEKVVLLRTIGEAYFEKRNFVISYDYMTVALQIVQEEQATFMKPYKIHELLCLYLLTCMEKERQQPHAALYLAKKAKIECSLLKMESSVLWVQLHLVITSILVELRQYDEAHATLLEIVNDILPNSSYDTAILLELDALLMYIFQKRGKRVDSLPYFENLKDIPECYDKSISKKREDCDYLLDCGIWSHFLDKDDSGRNNLLYVLSGKNISTSPDKNSASS